LSAAVIVYLNEAATTVELSSKPNPSRKGQAVVFTATVKASVLKSTPTGTVAFKDGAKKLGSARLHKGVAKFATKSLKIGTHKITANYSGDKNFNPNQSAVLKQKVN